MGGVLVILDEMLSKLMQGFTADEHIWIGLGSNSNFRQR